jgi:putative lipoic acid-binding regulatory protein
MADEATLIEYPCDFPLKILGRSEDGFAQAVAAVVRAHAPGFDPAAMTMRASSGGKYLSLTCTVHATSRAQLDGLYKALCDHPMVAMVL